MTKTKPAIKSTEIITSLLTLITTLYYVFYGVDISPEDKARYLSALTAAYSLYIMYARAFLTDSKIKGIFKSPPSYLLLGQNNTIVQTFVSIKSALLFVKENKLTKYTLIDEQSGEVILKVIQEVKELKAEV